MCVSMFFLCDTEIGKQFRLVHVGTVRVFTCKKTDWYTILFPGNNEISAGTGTGIS